MLLAEFKTIQRFDKVKLHSLESNLYQLSVIIDDQESYILQENGCLLTSRNKLDLQTLFKGKDVGSMVLCHQSTYDEMIGQPIRERKNDLEVPLGIFSYSY